jgi:hypothetical protein
MIGAVGRGNWLFFWRSHVASVGSGDRRLIGCAACYVRQRSKPCCGSQCVLLLVLRLLNNGTVCIDFECLLKRLVGVRLQALLVSVIGSCHCHLGVLSLNTGCVRALHTCFLLLCGLDTHAPLQLLQHMCTGTLPTGCSSCPAWVFRCSMNYRTAAPRKLRAGVPQHTA